MKMRSSKVSEFQLLKTHLIIIHNNEMWGFTFLRMTRLQNKGLLEGTL